MKYYGIKRKIVKERLLFTYAKAIVGVRSLMPGKSKENRKYNYKQFVSNDFKLSSFENALPTGHYFMLDQFITADLICREDLPKLQKGVRDLLMSRRTSKFPIGMPIGGVDEICDQLTRMNPSLLKWYNRVRCGVFDFTGMSLESAVDYFFVNIVSVNSSYLSIEFTIHLSDAKQQELNSLISQNYEDQQGHVISTLSRKRGKSGARKAYSVIHYNEAALKADKIFEFISCIEWDFFNALKTYFPFVLHQKGIMPPRIEVYNTDIDYHEKHNSFWTSVGVSSHHGQFINENHKIFFECGLSGRYDNVRADNRLIYIVNDASQATSNSIPVDQMKSMYLQECSHAFFTFLILQLLSAEAGKIVVAYKYQLDRIGLKKNNLKKILKLHYCMEKDIDFFKRYTQDDAWKSVKYQLHDLFSENDELIEKYGRPLYYSNNDFCLRAESDRQKVTDDIIAIANEFSLKESILQHLYDYKNVRKNWRLNVVMFLFTLATLFFVVFPDKIEPTASAIREVYHYLLNLFR